MCWRVRAGTNAVLGLILVAGAALSAASSAMAQDQLNPEELNRKYQDALAQLRAAQDRRNELTVENEKLTARIAELEKQVTEAQRQAAALAEQSFLLRSHYAAWQAFLRRYPQLAARWKLFIESNPLAQPSDLPEWLDPHPPTTQG
jgi:chromosome segregation ATPase